MDTYIEFCIRFWEATRELDLYSMDSSQLDRLIVDALSKTNGGKELIKTSMNELSVLIRAINHNNRKIQPPSLPSELEEAADESMPEEEGFLEIDIYGGSEAVYSREQMLAMFKAGAEWQKQHDAELIEIAYNDGITIGVTKQKEQMMKEAVEGEYDFYPAAVYLDVPIPRMNHGDKVRVIVCKKED